MSLLCCEKIAASTKSDRNEGEPKRFDKKSNKCYKEIESIVSAPRVFYDPQLQIISCYIARYYVRK